MRQHSLFAVFTPHRMKTFSLPFSCPRASCCISMFTTRECDWLFFNGGPLEQLSRSLGFEKYCNVNINHPKHVFQISHILLRVFFYEIQLISIWKFNFLCMDIIIGLYYLKLNKEALPTAPAFLYPKVYN